MNTGTTDDDVRIRPATPGDADAMVRFVDMASEGLAPYYWRRLAGPEGDPFAIGAERARRDTGAFSWRNAVMLELGSRVAGTLVGYPLAAEPEPVDEAEVPALFLPLVRLEAKAPGTWYVNILAVEPDLRGRGLGARLLLEADEIARRSGSRGLSLVVSDANRTALRLYERAGYRTVASEPMVKEGWENPGSAWILMVKD